MTNKEIGKLCILGPIGIGIVSVFFFWLGLFIDAEWLHSPVLEKVLGFFLGLMLAAVPLALIVGIPIGIVFFFKRDDQVSGTHSPHTIAPENIKGWNWGAFGLTLIWGIYHRVWISLLTLIPLIGLPVKIYLGIFGNELAWKKNKWNSVEQFKQAQQKWRIWGILAFIITLLYGFHSAYKASMGTLSLEGSRQGRPTQEFIGAPK